MEYCSHLNCNCCNQTFYIKDCLMYKSNPDRRGLRWYSWQCPKCNSILRLELKK